MLSPHVGMLCQGGAVLPSGAWSGMAPACSSCLPDTCPTGLQGSPEEVADFTLRTMSPPQSRTKDADSCRQVVQACARWATQAEASPAFLDAAVAGAMGSIPTFALVAQGSDWLR